MHGTQRLNCNRVGEQAEIENQGTSDTLNKVEEVSGYSRKHYVFIYENILIIIKNRRYRTRDEEVLGRI
jgi:hypothetical protein